MAASAGHAVAYTIGPIFKHIDAVKKMIVDNRRTIIREIAADVGISFDSCQVIFTDVLGKKLAAAKIVAKLLNFEQKQPHADIQICTKRS